MNVNYRRTYMTSSKENTASGASLAWHGAFPSKNVKRKPPEE